MKPSHALLAVSLLLACTAAPRAPARPDPVTSAPEAGAPVPEDAAPLEAAPLDVAPLDAALDLGPAGSPDAAGPSDATGAADGADGAPPGPPLALAGVGLWLDAEVGVERVGNEVRRWTDRSGHRHVFVAEGLGGAMPTFGQLGQHAAVHFDGKVRMVSNPVELDQRAALTLGVADFCLAVVVKATPSRRDTQFPFALGPRLGPDSPNIDISGTWFFVSLHERLELRFGLNEPTNVFSTARGGPYDDGRPRLLVIEGLGAGVGIRADRDELLADANGRRESRDPRKPPLVLPFAPAFIGNWDFDFPGLIGELAEVVLVIGPEARQARPQLEPYLRAKYGLR